VFLKNHWYVAAEPHELDAGPLARMILGEPVVLYRRADGAPAALEDRCCHRRMPLSHGRVCGNNLECGYHGLVFAPDGACVAIPNQDRIPPGARVRSYPCVERWGWIWIFPGDARRAEATPPPDFFQHGSAGWTAVGGYLHVGANHQLLVDNLLDLSHVGYVHRGSIGTDDAKAGLKTERGPDWVRMTRTAGPMPPPPLYAAQGLRDPVNQKQVMRFAPGANIWIDIDTFEARAADVRSIFFTILNAITPETATSCHYFFANARNFAHDDAKLSELLRKGTFEAFGEDKLVLEAQQKIIDLDPAAPQIDIDADAGGLQARRIVDRLLAEENAAQAAA
jgi:vanillate O-demethylase monooxygenase subunit